MTALLIGYARCSTDQQDLTAQRDGLAALGVAANRVYVDHGLTGTNRKRPGLREALAACREGDALVVTKLDRLATARRSAIGTRGWFWRDDGFLTPNGPLGPAREDCPEP
jgi:DNA invertase Pin-like site-specific DNA recombinase